MDKYSIVIPGRLASTRLPGKMLKILGGKPVIQHTIEHALQVRNCQQVYVVTDSEVIVNLAQSLGVEAFLTTPECRSGTERIVSVLDQLQGDWIFNIQGDEPFVDPRFIEEMIDYSRTIEADLLTPVYRLKKQEDIFNPNIVKAVVDNSKNALYFSRSPIPFVRDEVPENWLNEFTFWGHLGIYGFRRSLLEHYSSLQPSALEKAESLEQLRFLSYGYRIATYEAPGRSVAIDTPEDLVKAEALLKEQSISR